MEHSRTKPTILVVTELFPESDTSYSGTFVVEQLRALQRWYNFVVLVPEAPRNYFFYLFAPPVRFVRSAGCDVYFVKYRVRGNLFLRILRHLRSPLTPTEIQAQAKHNYGISFRNIAKKLHSLHHFAAVHGHETKIGDEAVPLSEMLQIPSLVTIHGIFEHHRKLWGDDIMNTILGNLRRATALIAVSHLAGNSYLQHLGKCPPIISIIPNGLTAHKPLPLLPDWKKVIAGRKVILGVGTFTVEKRFRHLVTAFAALKNHVEKNWVLVLIGSGPEEYNLRAQIRQCKLDDAIVLPGPTAPEKISMWFQVAELLAHPSVVESFSMVSLEAISFRKPIIITSVIGFAEYVENEVEALIIPPDDVIALTSALRRLMESSNLRKRMGEAAWLRSQEFAWPSIAPRIREVYEQITQ